MSSSFDNITRRLDISQSTVDTTYNKSRSISRALKKIPYVFTIPAFSWSYFVTGLPDDTVDGAFLGQVNYTAPSAFKILAPNFPLYNGVRGLRSAPMITIRYRVGSVVTRYRLLSNVAGDNTWLSRYQKVFAPAYTQQIIQPNFCVEFWKTRNEGALFANSLETEITTNRFVVPAAVDDLVSTFYGTSYSRADLALAMPENLSVQYVDASAWLTN